MTASMPCASAHHMPLPLETLWAEDASAACSMLRQTQKIASQFDCMTLIWPCIHLVLHHDQPNLSATGIASGIIWDCNGTSWQSQLEP